MRLLLEERWEDFKELIKDKELILFGASSCADIFINRMKLSFEIKYILDNDVKKHGKLFDGKYIINSPDVLDYENENSIVVITSTYYNEIIEQLEKMGYKGRVYSYFHLREKAMSVRNYDDMDKNINELIYILADKKSVDIVKMIAYKRKNNIRDYSDINEGEQYFLKDIFTNPEGKDEVFVDGGAYDGETVEKYIKFVNGNFKKIYSFEMDKVNYDMINVNKYDSRVEFLNYGLWNGETQISFISNEKGSEEAEEGSESAQCISIDNFIKDKVTFIKMDIEGAEMKALEGAVKMITENKPKLAICLYHKFKDLWEIPFYIHKLVPEYNLYIRHHSDIDQETVLYATVNE